MALVTGATAGIGAAFARRLAADGYDLVLLARDEDRLRAFADELRSAHGINVETLAADLATDAGLAAAEQRAADGIDLLVNNAGFGHRGWFLHAPLDVELTTMRVHCEAVLRLSYAALPGMLRRRAGGVINVASIAALLARGTYGASKAWVVSFSESVAAELAGTGVTVTAVCPGWVRTEFHQRADLDVADVPKALWLTPETVVDAALRDFARGVRISIPTGRYKLIVALNRAVPRRLAAAVSSRVGSRRTGRRVDATVGEP